MVKILFLVKNGQKTRHGCVKSEHVLYVTENDLNEVREGCKN